MIKNRLLLQTSRLLMSTPPGAQGLAHGWPHVGPTAVSVDAMLERAKVRWVAFPKWQADASTTLEPLAAADVLLGLIQNAFNYDVQGEQGFRAATAMARAAKGSGSHSNFDEALRTFGALS